MNNHSRGRVGNRLLPTSLIDQALCMLRERLENPRVPASQLHGRKDQYKIKLRGAGYRLVYSVEDEIITVTVIGVGKRENDAVYKVTRHRS